MTMLAGDVIDASSPLIDLGDRIPLNRTDDAGVWWVVTSVTGWGGPASTSESEQRKGAHGSWQTKGYYSSREIGVTGVAVAPSQAAAVLAADRLKAAVSLADFQFTVDEHGLQRYLTVRRSGEIDIDQVSTRFTFSFGVTVGDPFKYAVNEDVTVCEMLKITGGLSVPSGGLSVPSGGLSIPTTITQELGLVVNQGTAEADTRIRIYGPASNPIVVNQTTGQLVQFKVNIGSGDYLEINSFKKSVRLNGESDRVANMFGDWFTLPVGNSTFGYQADTYQAASHMDIYWRNRWE